ncbi:calpain-2 catalytic subunit-like isoform X1 [Danaus plexippus]|uniref:calpain-2 catalytic subunit-like isoform X1 n=2 Tax=Danaus plexippus TaxID=13037 RepID=UPI002AB23402|nr:calpain-2 catalytic subunit-like isoform X1 [Danaus plexippus]XP_061379197.1 calpain-2 catalytic subunit-like isoform X1 [Danaus plexippus]XP_061379198.1 calpain-2 catalytic subunit-like isoform X1 [Danaus plexippus]
MRKFMRTRPGHSGHPGHTTLPGHVGHPALIPHAAIGHKTNGVTNGVGGGPRKEELSTLPRYWSSSEDEGVECADGVEALFMDRDFPAAASSLGDRRLASRTSWIRPHEICPRPRFLGDAALEAGLSNDQLEDEPAELQAARWDVRPGAAGDALSLAAAALSHTPRLLARVAPPHSFRTRYTGKFRFRFWVFGSWREVVVDDLLPTRGGVLLTARGGLLDDFTLPLLEKAYAKLQGSLASLRGCGAAQVLQDLTGAVVQSFSPPRQPRSLLLQVLHSAVPRSTLLVASTERGTSGLMPGRAYLVTGLARVRETGGEGALVRLLAAGGPAAWSGAWSRGSPEWRALPPADLDLLAGRLTHPGHFWMSFQEFARLFSRLELVHIGPDDWLLEPALHARRPWRAVLARRRWRRGYNAGGPPACTRTVHANPQFHVHVPRSESGKCHVVVSVTQQYSPAGSPDRLHGIGFAVYELPPGTPPPRAPRAPAALADLRALDVTHWSRAREVATFFTLPAGQYLVVPHTHRPHLETTFLLRILTDEHTDVWEVNDDNVIVRDVATEFLDEGCPLEPEVQAAIAKTIGKRGIEEVDARALRSLLRRVWRRVLPARPSRALCGALVALGDPAAAGRLEVGALPALLARLALWRGAVLGAAPGCRAAVSAYCLRALLWACGVRASNKVLECLVLRFARGTRLSPDACVLALARLHLAHERFRSLDNKLKSNPISLEEMLLMTIYS